MNLKKTILACAAAVWALSANAQQAGEKFVGTMLGVGITKQSTEIGGTKYEDDPTVTLRLDPGFHFFLTDHFRLGLQAQLLRQSTKYDDGDKNSVGTFLIGPSAAFYLQLADRFYFAPELFFGFAHAKYKVEEDNRSRETKNNGFGFDVAPLVFNFRATQRLAFSASLFNVSLVHMKLKDSNPETTSNAFDFNLGVNPSVGIHFFL